jgi:hypothetical protein
MKLSFAEKEKLARELLQNTMTTICVDYGLSFDWKNAKEMRGANTALLTSDCIKDLIFFENCNTPKL